MRRVLPWLIGVAGAAGGIAVWARWLFTRRRYWYDKLTGHIPIHAAWWKDQRAREGEVLYVAIGDSAAQGIGASKPGRSYVGMLAKRLTHATNRTVRVVNLSISGATVGVALAKEVPQLAKLQPDILTVSIGANDMASFDAERFEREYRLLVEALPDHAILADLPSFYFLPQQRNVRQANAIIRRIAAERGLTVVDLHRLTDRQSVWGILTQFQGDLFHPNDRGYTIWANAFWPAVQTRMREFDASRPATDDVPGPAEQSAAVCG